MAKIDWKEFFLLFFVQLFQYCIICISYIALAKANYGVVFVTDLVCGVNSYFLIRTIAGTEGKSKLGIVGYVLGGATGSMLAIWISKRLV
jgi:hypothetical protein